MHQFGLVAVLARLADCRLKDRLHLREFDVLAGRELLEARVTEAVADGELGLRGLDASLLRNLSDHASKVGATLALSSGLLHAVGAVDAVLPRETLGRRGVALTIVELVQHLREECASLHCCFLLRSFTSGLYTKILLHLPARPDLAHASFKAGILVSAHVCAARNLRQDLF